MASTDEKPSLKITLEDLARVSIPNQPTAAGAGPATGTARQYGNIASPDAEPAIADEGKSNILLQGWFYLGAAGTVGALIGWAIGEPFFHDGDRQIGRHGFLGLMIIPLVLIFLCVGMSIAESIVERSLSKALQRAGLSLPLGLGLSVVFMIAGGLVFAIGQEICFSLGVTTYKNPLFWLARGLAWMVFAVAAGIAYGVVGRSFKKGQYGVLGALIGGGIGGMLFDPISIVTHSGGPSRAIGFALIGLTTGVAIGLVESALKDRWLYVAAGPLAGKQFILYKPITVIGSSQQCDIYLFKDPSILGRHGSIEFRGAQTFLHAEGQIFVSGQPAKNRALQSGDLIHIGKYAFHFRERHRK
jgi:Inner membrane component of T3SS, cytoplasmic domain